MADFFECCHHCKKTEKGIGCHGTCRDYKIAKIKNELRKRKERRAKEKEEAFHTAAFQRRKREFLKSQK